jgi:hypothetical protein
MKWLALPLLLLPFCSRSQIDVLILKKNGIRVKTYTPGMEINLETIYDQWFEGTLADIRHDSVFLNGLSFHYQEIKAIELSHAKLNYRVDGTILLAAGVGVMALGAVNGLIRGDPANAWYTPTSFITAGALVALGLAVRSAASKRYLLGKKYSLEYLAVSETKK